MVNTQIMYYCKLKPGLSKLPCKEKTVLPTKCVRFFQDETELTKSLDYANLKKDSLEIMIKVAEEDLHIKIRKKRGTKQ